MHGVRHAGHGQGEVHAYQFYPAVMYEATRGSRTPRWRPSRWRIRVALRPASAKDRVKDLLNLHDVYRALQVARQQRGAVDFETTETADRV